MRVVGRKEISVPVDEYGSLEETDKMNFVSCFIQDTVRFIIPYSTKLLQNMLDQKELSYTA